VVLALIECIGSEKNRVFTSAAAITRSAVFMGDTHRF
jgi:hypothetical protein